MLSKGDFFFLLTILAYLAASYVASKIELRYSGNRTHDSELRNGFALSLLLSGFTGFFLAISLSVK